MQNNFKKILFLFLALMLLYGTLFSSENPPSDSNLSRNENLLIKIREAASQIEQEILRRTETAHKEKLDTNLKFFKSKISSLENEIEKRDTKLTQSLIEFISENPKDKNIPFALFKLSQIYIEKANVQHEKDLDAYYKDKMQRGKTIPRKDLSLAIKKLQIIEQDYPTFVHRDAVLYLLGYAFMNELNPQATEVYYGKLREEFPGNAYISECYLRLGEYYFARKLFSKAIKSYQISLKKKDESLFDKTAYKLAWSYYLTGKYDAAISYFLELLDYNPENESENLILKEFKADAESYIAFSLYRQKSLRDAFKFLRQYHDKPYAYAIAGNIADIYKDRGFNLQSAQVYKYVLDKYPHGIKNPTLHASLLKVLDIIYAKSEQKKQWRAIAEDYDTKGSWRIHNRDSIDANKEADKLLENSLYSLAIVLDREGRAKKNANQTVEAIAYYKRLVDSFPTSEKSYNAQFYTAEAFLHLDMLEKSLAAYDSVLQNNYFNRYFNEALFSEIVVYEKMLSKRGELESYSLPSSGAPPKVIPDLPSKLLETCDLFIEKAPDDERTPKVIFRSAEIHDYFRNTDEAEKRYSLLINNHPGNPYALDAFRKSINIKISKSDWDAAIKSGSEYLKNPFQKDEKLAKETYEIVAVAEFKKGKMLEEEGKYYEAGEYLSQVSENFTESSVSSLAAINAFENYKKSDQHAKANKGLSALLEKSKGTSIAPSILLELGTREENEINFEKSAFYYFEIVKRYKNSPEHKNALLRLASIYEGTAQFTKAGEIYENFAKLSDDKQLVSESLLMAVINYAKAENIDKINRLSSKALKVFNKDNEKLSMYNLLLADLYFKKEQKTKFNKSFNSAQMFLKKARKPSQEVLDLNYKLTLENSNYDIKELFNIKLNFPMKSFLNSFEKKAHLLEKIEKAYTSIIKNAGIDIASRAMHVLGSSYENFAQGVLNTKIPESIPEKQKEQTKTELKKIGEPMAKKAKALYMKNISESKKSKTFNAWTEKSFSRFAEMIQSSAIKQSLDLDFKFKFARDIYSYPIIGLIQTDPMGIEKPSGLSGRFYEEALDLALKPDASKEELRRSMFLFDQSFRSDNSLKSSRFNKAVLSEKLGNTEVASFIYSSFLKDKSFRDKANINLARIFFKQGNLETAEKMYREHLKIFPDDPMIMANIAALERIKGNFANSMELSRRIFDLSYLEPRNFNNIAMIFRAKGEFLTAETIFKRGLELHPGNTLLLNNLSAHYIERKNYPEAYKTLKLAMSKNKYDSHAGTNYVYMLLKTRNFEEGLSFAKELWENYPDHSPALYLNLGLAYLSLKMEREALTHIDSNIKFAGPFTDQAKKLLSKLGEKRINPN